ncbi:uncharacterized protein LACBIDRAFT_297984 [Laccaria bicolor S238N-H82]|uniref:Predicted protein n=1 Tax=Laccaria bicolor (strain S238N-H82 / ATCC MYA-4686) TaxID=486041 RepID=B0DBZ9_LACBS|nr:uncharacterized protein LACBIDRAFT_297984 [Laccaria bicolor S238N-H82]EDR07808.1 predicted protein [Laccaria bicolor S238N-H82]|eukprot:XP_001881597.1 predicted protein [Laccaria bicolor S238N-H82]
MEAKPLSSDDLGFTLPPSNGHTSHKRRIASWPFLLITGCVLLLFKTYLSSSREHDWPIPPNVQIDRCAELNHNPSNNAQDPAPYSIPATFTLPLSSKALFCISRGSLSNGVINIVQSHKGAGSENVVVDVDVNYWEEPLLDNLKVCQVTREDGGVGVGIFSDWAGRPGSRQVEFEVTITLPRVPNDAMLYIDYFETDMPSFEHWIGELGDTVYFRSIVLGTEYRGVDVASLNGGNVEIKNSHSPIQGVINASSALSLITSNALINVFLGLSSSSSSDEATRLEMKTSNAEITASISLTTTSNSPGGNYSILTQTSFAKLTLTFPSSPLDSSLSLNARTSLASIDVSLHPTYEGTFTLDASLTPFGAKVFVDEDVRDPAGEGRKRKVEVRRGNGGGRVEGSVGWGDGEEGRGNVKLETVLGSANLRL